MFVMLQEDRVCLFLHVCIVNKYICIFVESSHCKKYDNINELKEK